MSYDQSRMTAPLLTCPSCGRPYYVTQPAPGWTCRDCQRDKC